MIKKNLPTLIITSLLVLLPLVWVVMAWNTLPDQIPVHFDITGAVDRYGDKSMLLGIPIVLLLVEWVVAIEACFRDKKKPFTAPYLKMTSWSCAGVSLAINIMTYNAINGNLVSAMKIVPLATGILFLVTGNVIPKLQQNKFAGFRVKWTLSDPDIWTKTHRLSGRVAIVAGLLMFPLALINNVPFMFGLLLSLLVCIIIVPFIYSYILYKKQVKSDGSTSK